MSPHLLVPVSRRRFLVGGGALAGAVLLGACSSDDDDGSASTTTEASTSALALAQFFGGPPMLTAGREIRAPFGLADAQALLPTEDTPEVLTVSILDAAGEVVVEPVEVQRHSKGLPRAYFPLRFTVDEPGIYTGRTEIDGESLEMAIQVDAAEDVLAIQVGERLPSMATPTTADPHGVDPICTNDPECSLHDVTLTQALADASPIALLVSTPKFCQVSICGPVLDVLLKVAGDYPTVRSLHMEVYAHPDEEIDTKAPVVEALQLTFEPCLILAGADGKVVERLDTIFDEDEVSDALTKLAG